MAAVSERVTGLFDLTGRRAIVTGGSRGLGLRIAEALGDLGAQLFLGARKPDELERAIDALRERGVQADAASVDMGDAQAVRSFADRALERLGHCDILVNNAGASWAAPAEDHPLEAWQKLVNVNMTGVFILCQEIGRRSMIPRRDGRILNIASVAGLRGNPLGTNHTLAYNTTKGGLVNFTRALAGEWGRYGINVNAIAPGFFPSKMSRGALDSIGEQIRVATPLQRLGDDRDMQGAAVLFCSDAGRHITGQILAVDGGVTAV
ncbi:MAG: SDR family oxidoreductase [Burkholderiaceae bacterium]|nr:SDR family oxidoreductase [Burkholderiaceae bacterium]